METAMRAIMSKVNQKEKDFINGQMGKFTMVNGIREKKMDQV